MTLMIARTKHSKKKQQQKNKTKQNKTVIDRDKYISKITLIVKDNHSQNNIDSQRLT